MSGDTDAFLPHDAIAPTVYFGGLASNLQHALTKKRDWTVKIQSETIVAKWRDEFVSQAADPISNPHFEGLTPAAAARVFDVTLAALRRAQRAAEGADQWDWTDPDEITLRPLKMTCPLNAVTICDECKCQCFMCVDGTYVDNSADEQEDEAAVEEEPAEAEEDYETELAPDGRLFDIRPARRLRSEHPGGTKESHDKCSCFPNYLGRIKEKRRAYLHETILLDPTAAALPQGLKRQIGELFDRLERTPNPDWHPGSKGMMQDLIHPSLGCYVRGVHDRYGSGDPCVAIPAPQVTPAKPSGWLSRAVAGVASMFSSKRAGTAADPSKALPHFQWLPADIVLDADGRVVTAVGRGFHGCPDAAASTVLLQTLECVLPALETVVNRVLPPAKQVVLRDRTIQVIAKAASASLTLEHPTFPEGSWHLEGIAAEQIIATAIYYPPTGPDTAPQTVGESKLSFRVAVDPEEIFYPQCGEDWVKVHCGFLTSDRRWERIIEGTAELGSVPTAPGTLLVFPNHLQHKVSSYSLQPGASSGRRRVLLFWVVAPAKRVLSTADVPDPTLGGLIGPEEQRVYRELLMLERKFVVAQQAHAFERAVSLCEH